MKAAQAEYTASRFRDTQSLVPNQLQGGSAGHPGYLTSTHDANFSSEGKLSAPSQSANAGFQIKQVFSFN